MLNIQVGDRAKAKDGLYGGEVVAINEEKITFKQGNSDMAVWTTLHYSQVDKLVLIGFVVTAVSIVTRPHSSS